MSQVHKGECLRSQVRSVAGNGTTPATRLRGGKGAPFQEMALRPTPLLDIGEVPSGSRHGQVYEEMPLASTISVMGEEGVIQVHWKARQEVARCVSEMDWRGK